MNQTLDYFHQLKHISKLWYFVNPNDPIPDYQHQIWAPFFLVILFEQIVLFLQKKSNFRLNDQITSLSHWILQESGRIIFRSAEYFFYIKVHEKFGILSLPWNSLWTWYLTALLVDFFYYWVHRANHEIHFLWAQHQVHHSSEEFNLVVGLRQSVFQQWCNFIFYLPLALGIPPSQFIVHHQINLIYQLWLHTTVIQDLGLLESIFNTPKHHRVHHGCNLYCLDKNYGGVLIIWDKLFGTFADEQQEIIYGLVVSPESFNPLYLQTFYTKNMIQKVLNMKTLSDKLSVIWKGPSWIPGTPRLGLDQFKINVTSRVKYNPEIPNWQKVYIVLHFFIALNQHFQIYHQQQHLLFTIFSNLFLLFSIGLIFDRFKYAAIVEIFRCTIQIFILQDFYLTFHLLSLTIWLFNY